MRAWIACALLALLRPEMERIAREVIAAERAAEVERAARSYPAINAMVGEMVSREAARLRTFSPKGPDPLRPEGHP